MPKSTWTEWADSKLFTNLRVDFGGWRLLYRGKTGPHHVEIFSFTGGLVFVLFLLACPLTAPLFPSDTAHCLKAQPKGCPVDFPGSTAEHKMNIT